MEVASREEIHTIAIFDNVENALRLQKYVYRNLQPGKNDPKIFGEQLVVNEHDEVEAFNDRLLIAATRLTLNSIVRRIHELEGLAIASHVDRPGYSIIGQLGFIPEDTRIDAVEISTMIEPQRAHRMYPTIKEYSLIRSSDAHFLRDIGKATTAFLLEEPTVAEIEKAFQGKGGRAMAYVRDRDRGT
jgi:hypothetical protein